MSGVGSSGDDDATGTGPATSNSSTGPAWPPLPRLDLDKSGFVGAVFPAMFTMDQDAIIVRRSDFAALADYKNFDEAFAAYCEAQHDRDAFRREQDDFCEHFIGRQQYDYYYTGAEDCSRCVLHASEFVTALPAFQSLEEIVEQIHTKYERWGKECEAASLLASGAVPDPPGEPSATKNSSGPSQSESSVVATYKPPPIAESDNYYLDHDHNEKEADFDADRYSGFCSPDGAARLLADADALANMFAEVGPYVARARGRFRNAIRHIHKHYELERNKYCGSDGDGELEYTETQLLSLWDDYDGPTPGCELHYKLQMSLPKIRFEIYSVTGDVVAKCSTTRAWTQVLHSWNTRIGEREIYSGGVASRISVAATLLTAIWYGVKERAIEFARQQHQKLRENFGVCEDDSSFTEVGMTFDENGGCAPPPPLTFLAGELGSGRTNVVVDDWKMETAKAGKFASAFFAFPFVFGTPYRFTYTLNAIGDAEGECLESFPQHGLDACGHGERVSYSFAFLVHPITGKICAATLIDADGWDKHWTTSPRSARERVAAVKQKTMALGTVVELEELFFARKCTTTSPGNLITDSELILRGKENFDDADAETSTIAAGFESTDCKTVLLRRHFKGVAAFFTQDNADQQQKEPSHAATASFFVDPRSTSGTSESANPTSASRSKAAARDAKAKSEALLIERPRNRTGSAPLRLHTNEQHLRCKHVDMCLTFESAADARQFAREFKLMKRIVADTAFFETMAKNFRDMEPWFERLAKVMLPQERLTELHVSPQWAAGWRDSLEFITGELHDTAGDRSEGEDELRKPCFGSATWLDLLRSVLQHRTSGEDVGTEKQLRDPISFTLMFPQRPNEDEADAAD